MTAQAHPQPLPHQWVMTEPMHIERRPLPLCELLLMLAAAMRHGRTLHLCVTSNLGTMTFTREETSRLLATMVAILAQPRPDTVVITIWDLTTMHVCAVAVGPVGMMVMGKRAMAVHVPVGKDVRITTFDTMFPGASLP